MNLKIENKKINFDEYKNIIADILKETTKAVKKAHNGPSIDEYLESEDSRATLKEEYDTMIECASKISDSKLQDFFSARISSVAKCLDLMYE